MLEKICNKMLAMGKHRCPMRGTPTPTYVSILHAYNFTYIHAYIHTFAYL